MSNSKIARSLILLAQKYNEDRDVLLAAAYELLGDGTGSVNTEEDAVVPGIISLTSLYPVSIFRIYKGKRFDARLTSEWAVEMNGLTYKSPSRAAISVSGHNENGWRTWKYIEPGTGQAEMIDRLRSK